MAGQARLSGGGTGRAATRGKLCSLIPCVIFATSKPFRHVATRLTQPWPAQMSLAPSLVLAPMVYGIRTKTMSKSTWRTSTTPPKVRTFHVRISGETRSIMTELDGAAALYKPHFASRVMQSRTPAPLATKEMLVRPEDYAE
jgi:hypothetical protein